MKARILLQNPTKVCPVIGAEGSVDPLAQASAGGADITYRASRRGRKGRIVYVTYQWGDYEQQRPNLMQHKNLTQLQYTVPVCTSSLFFFKV